MYLLFQEGFTYGSYSSINDNKYAASRFRATASVRNVVTDSSVVEILKEIDLINTEPISEKELKNTKAKYAGRFIMALEDPQTIARYALNIETENLPKDFYKTYLERLEKVTIEDVQNVAQKYFNSSNARVVVTGKGSEVLENLEKVTYKGKTLPVLFYTKTAEKTEAPNYEASIPEGLTAETIIEKYIESIGGKAKLEAAKSYAMTAAAEMQGMKLELEMKKTTNNQFMQDVKMMGNSMSKQVLNGDGGYMVAQGQRKDLSEEEVIKIKEESTLFPELNYANLDGISLEGMEMVGDKNTYKLKVNDKKSAFYDVETGLKLQEVNIAEMQGQQMTSTSNYENYREVDGILFPFKLIQTIGPQNFEFIVSEIKINDGVSDVDFE